MIAQTLKSRLTFANVAVVLALFLALSGIAIAAVKLKKNSVKSKHIADGTVQTRDFADGAIGAGKLAANAIAPNSITGAQVDEATLQAVNAARVSGLEVKRVRSVLVAGDAPKTVLVYPGKFRIDAECQNFGDRFDVTAFTGEDNSTISVKAMDLDGANDADGAHDIASRQDLDFDTTEGVEVDSVSEFGGVRSQATVQFAAPSGFTATAHLQMAQIPHPFILACALTGYSIGG